MKKLAFPLACVLSVASLNATNIIWISFHPGENQPSAGAAAAGFTTAPDAPYTQALTAAGYNVTRVVSSPTPNVAQLNAADLVIISRSVASGDYDAGTETATWNGITAPTMILGGYIGRQNRLGYVTASNIPDTVNPVTLQAVVPNHPIFNGITLGAGNTLSYAVPVSYTNSLQRGISTLTDPLAGGGTLIAKVDPAGQTTAANGMLIAEWQAGSVMADTAPSDTLGGHRMIFLTGSRENIISAEGSGMYDLTPEGKQLFLNAVSYMAVPEPSTYALLGLGGMALFFRRRKTA